MEQIMNRDPFDCWLPVKLLAEREPGFTVQALRYHILCVEERETWTGTMPGNGLGLAIRRVGRKVLVHHGRFRKWIETGSAA